MITKASKVKKLLEDIGLIKNVNVTNHVIFERPNNVSDVVIEYPGGETRKVSLNKNVNDAYKWLVQNYPGGDQNTTIRHLDGRVTNFDNGKF
jgi:hypothetical protein